MWYFCRAAELPHLQQAGDGRMEKPEVAGFQPQRHPTVLPKSSGTACWRRFGQGQEEPQESQGWLLVQARFQAMVPSHGCTRGPRASMVSVWPHNGQGFSNWFCAFCDPTTHFIACSNINTFEISTSDKQQVLLWQFWMCKRQGAQCITDLTDRSFSFISNQRNPK